MNGHVALVAPDGSVYSTSNLDPNPVKHHPSIADVEAYYAYYGMTLTYRGWTEDVAGYPVISVDGSIGFDSITPAPAPAPQEDTMTPEQMLELKTWVIDQVTAAKETTILDARAQIGAVGARLDRGIVISRVQAEDIVAATVARLTAAPAPAPALDVNALAAQLAPLLNTAQADAFMAAFKAQINK
ncbi:hypothetical protein AB4Z38_07155 [Arthrobacter sp. 2RAF6]